MWFSTQLLLMGNCPSSRYRVSAAQRFKLLSSARANAVASVARWRCASIQVCRASATGRALSWHRVVRCPVSRSRTSRSIAYSSLKNSSALAAVALCVLACKSKILRRRVPRSHLDDAFREADLAACVVVADQLALPSLTRSCSMTS